MLRILSLGLIAFILLTSLATVASQVPHLLFDIVVAAGLFILLAMAFGTVLGIKMSEEERHVTTIESGVRNIALALTLGALTMDKDDFSALAAFLTGYLAVEIAVMLPYAAFVARRRGPQRSIARP
jgi:predicted Na+-dependent transporter